MKFRWPFMLVSTHEAVRMQNFVLRDALREANNEVLKHRKLIAGIQSGQIDILKYLKEGKDAAKA